MTDVSPGIVYVVDDDEAFRDSLVWLLSGHHYDVRPFADGPSFLSHLHQTTQSEPHNAPLRRCVVLDIRMPELTGVQVQEQLQSLSAGMPIIFVTAHGDVPMAVEAIKRGAFDFIEKPFDDHTFIERVNAALSISAHASLRANEIESTRLCIANLTVREKQIMDMVIEGKLNKTIAYDLDISIKTVEAHRARVMEKLGVKSLAQLVSRVSAAQ
jgi:FixJ family two-component response regulator